MRGEQKIRKRLRQLLFRAYQKRAKRELKVQPKNCAFNHPTSTEFPDGNPFRICGLALETRSEMVGCNEDADARGCMTFVHAKDKHAIKEAVLRDVADPEVGPQDFPVIRTLAWVLDDPELSIEDDPSRHVGIVVPIRRPSRHWYKPWTWHAPWSSS